MLPANTAAVRLRRYPVKITAMVEQRRNWLQMAIAAALVAAIVVLTAGIYSGWWDFTAVVGRYTVTHWLGWIGSGYLAVTIPMYSVLKRVFKIQSPRLVAAHVFSNLIAFGAISVHFAYRLGPLEFTIAFGTGLVMYLVLTGIVTAGLIKHFTTSVKLQNHMTFIHRGLSLSLIIELPIHILRNT
jgi:hypothetical protein